MNEKISEIRASLNSRINNMNSVYNSYVSSVDSGSKEFLKDVVSGRVTAFKQGFYSHIIGYYSEQQANKRIQNLEDSHLRWQRINFE